MGTRVPSSISSTQKLKDSGPLGQKLQALSAAGLVGVVLRKDVPEPEVEIPHKRPGQKARHSLDERSFVRARGVSRAESMEANSVSAMPPMIAESMKSTVISGLYQMGRALSTP